jgi:D-tyrosyl-tRNA(Tyr) deacylase
LSSQLDAAYATTSAYVQVTTQSLERGRITAAQAARASASAKKVQATLDTARVALAGCKPEAPCTAYTDLMSSLQPALLELERELRARQAMEAAK